MTDEATGWVRPQPSLRTREARALDVSPGELAGPRWRRPHRGVCVPVGSDPDAPLQRIFEAAELLPDGCALGGWAAAFLHGADEFAGRGPGGTGRAPLPVLLPPRLHLARRRDVVHWRSRFTSQDVTVVHGIPVTTLARTGFDLGRKARSLDASVAVLDAYARQTGLDLTVVRGYSARRPRMGGQPLLRDALDLADPRSRSAGESRLRVLWIDEARLPRPECNPLVAGPDGCVLGMPDLLLPECGLVGEYDGELHRDLRRQTDDNAREERFEEIGLVVVRATSLDLGLRRARTVERLRRAHARARARTDPAGWLWRPSHSPRMVS